MKCPYCESTSIVIETRATVDGIIRRRRVCEKGHRFSSYQKQGGREVVRDKEEVARGK